MSSVTKAFSAAATGTQATLASPGSSPFATYAVQVKGVAVAASAWTVLLEGSIDGANWTTIATHNATDGSIVWETTGKPTFFVRVNVSALTLGSAASINVTVLAVP